MRRGYPWGYPQGEHVQTLGVSGLTSDYMNPIIGTTSKASTFQRGLAFSFSLSQLTQLKSNKLHLSLKQSEEKRGYKLPKVPLKIFQYPQKGIVGLCKPALPSSAVNFQEVTMGIDLSLTWAQHLAHHQNFLGFVVL